MRIVKQAEVKVSFYLKKNEMNIDGRCPVMARLAGCKLIANFISQITFIK